MTIVTNLGAVDVGVCPALGVGAAQRTTCLLGLGLGSGLGLGLGVFRSDRPFVAVRGLQVSPSYTP